MQHYFHDSFEFLPQFYHWFLWRFPFFPFHGKLPRIKWGPLLCLFNYLNHFDTASWIEWCSRMANETMKCTLPRMWNASNLPKILLRFHYIYNLKSRFFSAFHNWPCERSLRFDKIGKIGFHRICHFQSREDSFQGIRTKLGKRIPWCKHKF